MGEDRLLYKRSLEKRKPTDNSDKELVNWIDTLKSRVSATLQSQNDQLIRLNSDRDEDSLRKLYRNKIFDPFEEALTQRGTAADSIEVSHAYGSGDVDDNSARSEDSEDAALVQEQSEDSDIIEVLSDESMDEDLSVDQEENEDEEVGEDDEDEEMYHNDEDEEMEDNEEEEQDADVTEYHSFGADFHSSPKYHLQDGRPRLSSVPYQDYDATTMEGIETHDFAAEQVHVGATYTDEHSHVPHTEEHSTEFGDSVLSGKESELTSDNIDHASQFYNLQNTQFDTYGSELSHTQNQEEHPFEIDPELSQFNDEVRPDDALLAFSEAVIREHQLNEDLNKENTEAAGPEAQDQGDKTPIQEYRSEDNESLEGAEFATPMAPVPETFDYHPKTESDNADSPVQESVAVEEDVEHDGTAESESDSEPDLFAFKTVKEEDPKDLLQKLKETEQKFGVSLKARKQLQLELGIDPVSELLSTSRQVQIPDLDDIGSSEEIEDSDEEISAASPVEENTPMSEHDAESETEPTADNEVVEVAYSERLPEGIKPVDLNVIEHEEPKLEGFTPWGPLPEQEWKPPVIETEDKKKHIDDLPVQETDPVLEEAMSNKSIASDKPADDEAEKKEENQEVEQPVDKTEEGQDISVVEDHPVPGVEGAKEEGGVNDAEQVSYEQATEEQHTRDSLETEKSSELPDSTNTPAESETPGLADVSQGPGETREEKANSVEQSGTITDDGLAEGHVGTETMDPTADETEIPPVAREVESPIRQLSSPVEEIYETQTGLGSIPRPSLADLNSSMKEDSFNETIKDTYDELAKASVISGSSILPPSLDDLNSSMVEDSGFEGGRHEAGVFSTEDIISEVAEDVSKLDDAQEEDQGNEASTSAIKVDTEEQSFDHNADAAAMSEKDQIADDSKLEVLSSDAEKAEATDEQEEKVKFEYSITAPSLDAVNTSAFIGEETTFQGDENDESKVGDDVDQAEVSHTILEDVRETQNSSPLSAAVAEEHAETTEEPIYDDHLFEEPKLPFTEHIDMDSEEKMVTPDTAFVPKGRNGSPLKHEIASDIDSVVDEEIDLDLGTDKSADVEENSIAKDLDKSEDPVEAEDENEATDDGVALEDTTNSRKRKREEDDTKTVKVSRRGFPFSWFGRLFGSSSKRDDDKEITEVAIGSDKKTNEEPVEPDSDETDSKIADEDAALVEIEEPKDKDESLSEPVETEGEGAQVEEGAEGNTRNEIDEVTNNTIDKGVQDIKDEIAEEETNPQEKIEPQDAKEDITQEAVEDTKEDVKQEAVDVVEDAKEILKSDAPTDVSAETDEKPKVKKVMGLEIGIEDLLEPAHSLRDGHKFGDVEAIPDGRRSRRARATQPRYTGHPMDGPKTRKATQKDEPLPDSKETDIKEEDQHVNTSTKSAVKGSPRKPRKSTRKKPPVQKLRLDVPKKEELKSPVEETLSPVVDKGFGSDDNPAHRTRSKSPLKESLRDILQEEKPRRTRKRRAANITAEEAQKEEDGRGRSRRRK